MNVSGKSTSRAPLPAASAATSSSRPIVASRSNSTGSTCAQATVTRSCMRLSSHAEQRLHAERGVVRDGAPEPIAPGPNVDVDRAALTRPDERNREGVHPADAPDAQVVRILAVVLELDLDDAGLHRRARERQVVLGRADAEPRGRRVPAE